MTKLPTNTNNRIGLKVKSLGLIFLLCALCFMLNASGVDAQTYTPTPTLTSTPTPTRTPTPALTSTPTSATTSGETKGGVPVTAEVTPTLVLGLGAALLLLLGFLSFVI